MLPIQNIYTGQNAGVIIPDSPKTDRAREDYYKQQFDRGEQILRTVQERQKAFMDFSDYQTIEVLNEADRLKQLALINDFEKKAKKVYAASIVNPMALLELRKEKEKLISFQQGVQATKKLIEQEQQMVASNPSKYYVDKFQEKIRGYYNGEGYQPGLLPAPKNLDELASGIYKRMGGRTTESQQEVTNTSDPNNTVVTRGTDISYDYTEDQTKQFFFQDILTNPDKGYEVSLVEEFGSLLKTDPEKMKYYLDKADADNNGVFSPEEKKNAALEYAFDIRKERGLFDTKYRTADVVKSKPPSVGSGSDRQYEGEELKTVLIKPAQVNEGKEALALQLPNMTLNMSVKTFDQLKDKGYPTDQLEDVEFKHIIGDEYEATVHYKGDVDTWVQVGGGKLYSNDEVEPYAVSGMGKVKATGEIVKKATALPRDVTVSGKVTPAVKAALASKINNFDSRYSKYIEEYKSQSSPLKGKNFMIQGKEYTYEQLKANPKNTDDVINNLVAKGTIKIK